MTSTIIMYIGLTGFALGFGFVIWSIRRGFRVINEQLETHR